MRNKKQQGVLVIWEIMRFRGCGHLVVNILMQTTDVGYCTQSHKQCLMMSRACRWHDSSRLKPIFQRISRNVSGSEISFDAKHDLFPNLKKWLYYLNPTLKCMKYMKKQTVPKAILVRVKHRKFMFNTSYSSSSSQHYQEHGWHYKMKMPQQNNEFPSI